MNTLDLLHLGGQRCTVTIISIGPGECIYLRFPFCSGEYKLDLKKNLVVFSRRAATWRAADIDACWALWNEKMGRKGVKTIQRVG